MPEINKIEAQRKSELGIQKKPSAEPIGSRSLTVTHTPLISQCSLALSSTYFKDGRFQFYARINASLTLILTLFHSSDSFFIHLFVPIRGLLLSSYFHFRCFGKF